MIALGLLFIVAGLFHFIIPNFYLSIMPPYLPKPRALVFLSGAIEIGLGSLMFFEETRSFGTLAITAFLVAVLPVHVYMLQERDRKFRAYPKAFLWARIPLQFVLMAWAMRYY